MGHDCKFLGIDGPAFPAEFQQLKSARNSLCGHSVFEARATLGVRQPFTTLLSVAAACVCWGYGFATVSAVIHSCQLDSNRLFVNHWLHAAGQATRLYLSFCLRPNGSSQRFSRAIQSFSTETTCRHLQSPFVDLLRRTGPTQPYLSQGRGVCVARPPLQPPRPRLEQCAVWVWTSFSRRLGQRATTPRRTKGDQVRAEDVYRSALGLTSVASAVWLFNRENVRAAHLQHGLLFPFGLFPFGPQTENPRIYRLSAVGP